MADIPPRQAQQSADERPPRPQYAGLFVAPPDLPPDDEDE
jgi:hypothetical protein